MRALSLLVSLLFIVPSIPAQTSVPDSVSIHIRQARTDIEKYQAYRMIYDFYEEMIRDSALVYALKTAEVAKRNGKHLAENYALVNAAYQLNSVGRYADAFQLLVKVFEVANDPRYDKEQSWPYPATTLSRDPRALLLSYAYHIFGQLMWQTDNNPKAISSFIDAKFWGQRSASYTRIGLAYMNIARSLNFDRKYDQALLYSDSAQQTAEEGKYFKYLGQVYFTRGESYRYSGNLQQAEQSYKKGMDVAMENRNLASICYNQWGLVRLFISQDRVREAIPIAMENLSNIRLLGPVFTKPINLGVVYENIYLCYQKLGNKDSILKYQQLTLHTKDSIYQARIKNLTEFQNLTLNEQLRLKNIEKEKIVYQNRIRNFMFFGGLAFLTAIALILYRNNRQKHRSNQQLQQAITELKETQSQLIHAEKMASLGQLTAGIAHEIQNPLNFVNNFSEVNLDLIRELREEQDPKLREEIEADLAGNTEKILHHGKRADLIVKGMLAHSRKNSGDKEPTDINNICDEYIRLAYHGFRATDSSFNVTIKQDLQQGLPKARAIPQDIGRVLLNLLNNAFYAVRERSATDGPSYEPTVRISTRLEGQSVCIDIEDNGPGIPEASLNKIFQPFFTTKPTGSGTGLGLSLSYDIVKAHGGALKAETKEGAGSTFRITLPLSST